MVADRTDRVERSCQTLPNKWGGQTKGFPLVPPAYLYQSAGMHLHVSVVSAAACLAALWVLPGCGKKNAAEDESAPSSGQKEDWVQTKDATPEERACLDYGRSVVQAVANRTYAGFYAQLAAQARARLSLNQFAPEDDEAAFARNEKQPRLNVTLPEFLELMSRAEKRFGKPLKPLDLHVHSSDPAVLSGAKREGLDALDTMFAIGNMPAQIPAASRKASLRAKISVELTAAELAETAKQYKMSVEELQKDEDFKPYLTLKLVLVTDADGQLRVGYFEFLPPSMMD